MTADLPPSRLPPDLIIAASAIEHKAVLLHADADFDQIAANSELRVESFAEAGR